ncbi:MAG: pyridoxal phosphate-dependent aminotransferase [Candidatus Omnitrophica bacterium]|nr:pyridoxal phosphate-dependent aminotransferase [Candidatus Omnitrophota bacterium]
MSLAKRILKVCASSTLVITAKAKKMQKEGVDVVSFGAGEPDFDTPKNIKEAAKRAIEEGFTKYTPSSGIGELKEAICQKFKNDNNLEYKSSQIVVSCGAKHSIYNAIQVLCQKGDEVIIPSPYWVSYPEMVRLAEATPVIVHTERENGFKLTEKELKRAITKRTKLLILNSPSNPTGTVYDQNELFFISEVAAERGIYVLSDEIYEKILYDGARHISIASFNNKIYNLTLVVNGVSKTYSMTGWRVGYLAGPQDIINAIDNLQSHSTSNPASISQKAALEAMTGMQDFIADMVGEFKKRRDYMIERLSRIKGFSPFIPKGAFYVFPNVAEVCKNLGIMDAFQSLPQEMKKKTSPSTLLQMFLLYEYQVATMDRKSFGRIGTEHLHYLRLSFATDTESLKEGIQRITRAAQDRKGFGEFFEKGEHLY